MHFIFPRDGDMLDSNDGYLKDGRLFIRARVAALPKSVIYINMAPAIYDGALYCAEVPLDGYRNILAVYDASAQETSEVVVYWLKNAAGNYRLSLDDNIWCMRDLTRNADSYGSIFDNPYFALYKKIHDQYGTKVHMNLYYQCDGFDLSMMPLKYKPEFEANADWLKFSFHALQNDPDRPYLLADYDELLRDFDLVTGQIIRFAGEACLSPVTTVHWGECPREGVRALRARGMRCLMGYFRLKDHMPKVAYYLDLGEIMNLSGRDFWIDSKEDMIFGRINCVLNEGSAEDIISTLESDCALKGEKAGPRACTRGFLEVMIHEQYFYPEYSEYLPDFEKRVLTAVQWAADNGYKPGWIHDSVLEYPISDNYYSQPGR